MTISADDLEEWRASRVTQAVVAALRGHASELQESAVTHFLNSGADLPSNQGWPVRMEAKAFEFSADFIAEADPEVVMSWMPDD